MLNSGCDDFIGKPFKAQEIFAKIAQHLGVQYVYEDGGNQQVAPTSNTLDLGRRPELLGAQPPAWLERLRVAATQGNDLAIFKLMEEIPPEAAP